jgi:hypothetical protein
MLGYCSTSNIPVIVLTLIPALQDMYYESILAKCELVKDRFLLFELLSLVYLHTAKMCLYAIHTVAKLPG